MHPKSSARTLAMKPAQAWFEAGICMRWQAWHMPGRWRKVCATVFAWVAKSRDLVQSIIEIRYIQFSVTHRLATSISPSCRVVAVINSRFKEIHHVESSARYRQVV